MAGPEKKLAQSAERDLAKLGQGFYWQEIKVGQRFRTYRRTITEADLVNFIGVTGMLEAIFIDANYEGAAIPGRLVPAALTYSLIEGFVLQSMIQGTGLAMLEMAQKIHGPVRVNDSIWAVIEVTEIRPTSKNNRAIVGSHTDIFNQNDELVLSYTCKRMLAGK